MKKFKELFSFNQKEVALLFSDASTTASLYGIKLLRFNQGAPTPHGKLLVVASRAVGKAHDRNLLRRQIKAIFYEHKLQQAPHWWAVILYPQAKKLAFAQLEAFLVGHVKG